MVRFNSNSRVRYPRNFCERVSSLLEIDQFEEGWISIIHQKDEMKCQERTVKSTIITLYIIIVLSISNFNQTYVRTHVQYISQYERFVIMNSVIRTFYDDVILLLYFQSSTVRLANSIIFLLIVFFYHKREKESQEWQRQLNVKF